MYRDLDKQNEKVLEDNLGVNVFEISMERKEKGNWWSKNTRILAIGCLALLVLIVIISLAISIGRANKGQSSASGSDPEKYQDSSTQSIQQSTTKDVLLQPLLDQEQNVSSQESALYYDSFGRPGEISGIENGIVAADIGVCSEVGVDIMKEQGGNAIDALVAVVLCQGVLNPMASGVGGGGFITINFQGNLSVIDAREYAPQNADKAIYENSTSDVTKFGGLAVAVPLELIGLENAHSKYGVLPWKDLFDPAIKFAEEGFDAHPHYVEMAESMMVAYRGYGESEFLEKFQLDKAVLSTFWVGDREGGYRAPELGERCCQRPVFAETLRAVAEGGTEALYQGQLGRSLVDDINNAGGIFEYSDIINAKVVEREPFISKLGKFEFVQPPPPSSACLIPLAINIYAILKSEFKDELLDYHYLIEIMKHIFAIRMHLGDEDFVDLEQLLDDIRKPEFALNISNYVNPNTTFPAGDRYGGGYPPIHPETQEDSGTSHISIVDQYGNAVAMTTTINTNFGSLLVSKSTGILLNNEMDDFSVATFSNTYGLAPSEANFIYPGKKPLSSTSPTIINDPDGKPIIVAGASGGPKIITGTLQAILRILFGSQDAGQAVAAVQLHDQLYPQLVQYENYTAPDPLSDVVTGIDKEIVEGLQRLNHHVLAVDSGSVRQVIIVGNDGTKNGASDPRKNGAPAGY
eukprot:TRINITY_DN31968_c0_g2_i1.p1 TRINITY_DN31968_c0_g2~~TRINITY_DN31968_c0_g2_i1.p1  ORF type:complete len:691 (-),score=122.07 TRINITY_DN31968_c0_g2_i1:896-2968(-)